MEWREWGRWVGFAILALSVWPVQLAAQPPKESCVTCHLESDDAQLMKPAQDFVAEDIHAAKGFGCVSCHGGNSMEPGLEAMDADMGYIGAPARGEIAQICGRCHSDARFMKRYNPALPVDQVIEYASSVHGQRLREADDPKVATCTGCHPAHSIKPPSDPNSSVHPLRVAATCGACHADAKYMESYDIPTDQAEKYKQSIHWRTLAVKGDLSAPTCNDCHGNHGATPPGLSWVGNVCGQCHVVIADLFAKSAHSKHLVDIGSPGCATCHNAHDITPVRDAMLGLDADQAVCATCHSAEDKGGKTATRLRQLIDSLRTEYDKAHAVLLRAEHAGMEVSQAQFDLIRAADDLIKARTAIHTFTIEPVQKETAAGVKISRAAYASGVRALHELKLRRQWLVFSMTIILAVIVGLVLKTRQIERDEEVRSGPPAEEKRDD